MSLNTVVKAFYKGKRPLLPLLWTAVAPLALSLFTTFYISQINIELETDIYWWLLIVFSMSLLMSLALLPTTFLALLSGYYLSWLGVAPIICSYILASCYGYFAAKWFDQGWIDSQLKKRASLNQVIRKLNKRPFVLTIICRLSPFLPFAMMNLVLAYVKVPFKTYIVAGTIGMLPRTLAFIWIGTLLAGISEEVKIEEISTEKIVVTLLFSAIAIIWGFLYYRSSSRSK